MTSAAYRPLRPTGTGEPPAPVGRAGLLARLERVLASRGRALLTGPAGVGKTELALTLAARAESRGDTVLWLPTLPTDRSIPGATAAALVAAVRARVSWPWPWTTEADAGPSDSAGTAGPSDSAGTAGPSDSAGTAGPSDSAGTAGPSV
ncbi:ATP-binding protein, partial [Streptomyces sp. NPDC007861]|uniref:ATP-binding protein n=1 Tax=Streptomyces sp. NPDC007861 TaxID=3154893 RepID=UPI0033E2776F